MKRKSIISLCLLTVYLLLMVVPAFVSLTCPCVARTVQGKRGGCCGGHLACCVVGHHHTTPDASTLKTGCDCKHSHDTEVELYTLPSSGEERMALRCVVFELPATIGCEVKDTDFNSATHCHLRIKPVSAGDLCCLQTLGLRAPPVCA